MSEDDIEMAGRGGDLQSKQAPLIGVPHPPPLMTHSQQARCMCIWTVVFMVIMLAICLGVAGFGISVWLTHHMGSDTTPSSEVAPAMLNTGEGSLLLAMYDTHTALRTHADGHARGEGSEFPDPRDLWDLQWEHVGAIPLGVTCEVSGLPPIACPPLGLFSHSLRHIGEAMPVISVAKPEKKAATLRIVQFQDYYECAKCPYGDETVIRLTGWPSQWLPMQDQTRCMDARWWGEIAGQGQATGPGAERFVCNGTISLFADGGPIFIWPSGHGPMGRNSWLRVRGTRLVYPTKD